MPVPRLGAFWRFVVCALGVLIVQSVVATIVVGVYLLNGVANGNTLSPAQIEALATRNALWFSVASIPAALLVIWACRALLDRRSLVSLGVRRRRWLPDAGRGALAGVLAIGTLWALLWLSGAIAVSGWSSGAQNLGADAIWPLLGLALAFCAVGFFEELLFRGYALHNLNSMWGWSAAVVVQAILFALAHAGNIANFADIPSAIFSFPNGSPAALTTLFALPNIALVGVFFALAALKTGSLWFPIGFHTAWNWSLGCVFSLPVSGLDTFRLLEVTPGANLLLSGGPFGAEGSVLLLPLLAALVWMTSRLPDHPQWTHDLSLLSSEALLPSPEPLERAPSLPGEPQMEATVEEELRENRFRSRFGSATGFDGQLLDELRALDEQRAAERREQLAAQQELERARQREIAANAQFEAPPNVEAHAPISAPEIKPQPVPVARETAANEQAASVRESAPQAVETVVTSPATPRVEGVPEPVSASETKTEEAPTTAPESAPKPRPKRDVRKW